MSLFHCGSLLVFAFRINEAFLMHVPTNEWGFRRDVNEAGDVNLIL